MKLEVDDEWYIVTYGENMISSKFTNQIDAINYQRDRLAHGFDDAQVYYNAEISIRIS